MRFNAWAFALLLALVPALLLVYAHGFRRRRRALALLVDDALAPRVLPGVRDRWGRAFCLVGAVACLAVALMQPRSREDEPGLPFQGRDIVVVLDVSLSMLAEDAAPSRLAQAKAAARSLLEALRAEGGHRLGLVTFAGRADVACPLTRDYALFLDRLAAAGAESVAQRGSSIGAALLQSLGMFGELEPSYTDLILLSDGEDHGSEPLQAARRLAAQGFGLYTVGIGSPSEAVPIPIARAGGEPSHLAYQGGVVLTRMRRGILAAMAEAAGGVYVPVENGSASLERLYRDHIAAKPRREPEASAGRDLPHPFQLFVILAIVLLGAEMVMRAGTGEQA